MDNLCFEARKGTSSLWNTCSHHCADHMEGWGYIELDFICKVAFNANLFFFSCAYSKAAGINSMFSFLCGGTQRVEMLPGSFANIFLFVSNGTSCVQPLCVCNVLCCCPGMSLQCRLLAWLAYMMHLVVHTNSKETFFLLSALLV